MKEQGINTSKQLTFCGWLAVLAAVGLAVGAAQAQVMLPTEQPNLDDGFMSRSHGWINNVTVVPRDDQTAVIQFDLAWHGSWRTDVNHDAVWMFFKFRTENDPVKGGWRHVFLKADKVLNPTGYGQAPAGQKLTFSRGKGSPWFADGDTKFDFLVPVDRVPTDGGKTNEVRAGVFVRRADHGMGTASGGKLTVLWDLTTCPDVKKDTKVQLQANEVIMMYVAEGPFYVGSGGSETYSFYKFQDEKKRGAVKERITMGGATMVIHEETGQDADAQPPYRITTSAAIPTGMKPGRLWARGAEPPDDGEIPATFPTGYNAFYTKRYPLTPACYAHMLDLLAPELADERYHPEGFPCHGGIGRKLIGEGPAYKYRGGGARKSCALWYLCWADCATYADWAALRPMSELEYEKCLRGPRLPEPMECGNSFWGGSFGGGRYNAHPSEMNVTVGDANGLAFKGTNGSGTATNWPADWPKKDAKGTGVRGGQEAASGPEELKPPFWCTSCRIDAAMADSERLITYGFRPTRTAPDEAKWNSVRNEEESSPLLEGLPARQEKQE